MQDQKEQNNTAAPEARPNAAEPRAGNQPEEKNGETELKKLEDKVKELENARLRLLAEMDNQRKRCSKDMESLRLNVLTDTVSPFLQVFDHFEMAVTASEKSDNLKSLIEGMKMIRNEFDKAFSELGVEKIDAVGKDFDPNLHEAVSQEASESVPSGKVIRQWSHGYKTAHRLLKPAMVIVSSGAPEKEKA